MRKYDPACVTLVPRGWDIGPTIRWVPLLGLVRPPVAMGNFMKSSLYTYIHLHNSIIFIRKCNDEKLRIFTLEEEEEEEITNQQVYARGNWTLTSTML